MENFRSLISIVNLMQVGIQLCFVSKLATDSAAMEFGEGDIPKVEISDCPSVRSGFLPDFGAMLG